MMSNGPFDLQKNPAHLGLGATTEMLPEFDGTGEWYMRYGMDHASDGAEGRLVSYYTFTESWDSWEVHPKGSELVFCVEGAITLHQEIDGKVTTVELSEGQAIINPPGAWHTADIDGRARALFITAGEGTENRPR
jgi:mannose-6-phosphate isomerase-like protein (cupin superfamily)